MYDLQTAFGHEFHRVNWNKDVVKVRVIKSLTLHTVERRRRSLVNFAQNIPLVQCLLTRHVQMVQITDHFNGPGRALGPVCLSVNNF